MSTPKLPSLRPLPLPSASTSEPKKGSGFSFFLLMMIFLLMTMQIFGPKKPEETSITNEQLAPSSQEGTTPVLSPEKIAALSPELVQQANETLAPEFITLGSMDASSPYRMLVTLTNRGAAVARIELNEKAYRDSQDDTGYLGQIVVNETLVAEEISQGFPGVKIQTVGAGTPAALAGLCVGDRLVSIQREDEPTSQTIDSFDTLRAELLKTKARQTVKLGVLRNGVVPAEGGSWTELPQESVSVMLQRAPINIVRPEGIIKTYDDYCNLRGLQGAVADNASDPTDVILQDTAELNAEIEQPTRKRNADPFSFLMTLGSYDDAQKLNWVPQVTQKTNGKDMARLTGLAQELDGVDLRSGFWKYLPEKSNESTAVFQKILLGHQLEILKTYSLVAAPDKAASASKKNVPEYHLTLKLEMRNLDSANPHKVSYVLDGPTGLPIEGGWYSMGRKTGPGWGTYGLRDLVLQMDDLSSYVIRCWGIANDESKPSERLALNYLGVDTQYFQCTFLPASADHQPVLHESYVPIRVGAKTKDHPTFTNVSFRLKSLERELAPSGQEGDSLVQEYQIFAGPKVPQLLNNYGLGKTLVYGWFWFVAKPLVAILHFFKSYIVFNYGLAIIMLTILVRLCLFPLSMKQVSSSIKMQQIQPELTALKKRYEGKPQEMMRAQQILFKKNGVNPLSGCLPIFIQLPIFIGLYKALSLDVNLYGTPLLSERIRWCSNLAAPDMLLDWSTFWNSIGWPGFNLSGQGFLSMFALGPYLNLLPFVTIVLFLLQQKFLMPPVVGDDEQARQQRMMRKMMTFMMIFMGFMFFKVPSGLCIYFIVSSLWGILERKFHPKSTLTPAVDGSNAAVDLEEKMVDGATPALATKEKSFLRTSSFESNENESKSPVLKSGKKKRNRRAAPAEESGPPKGKFRAWLERVVEKAKEQQKLAKAEMEKQQKKQRRKF